MAWHQWAFYTSLAVWIVAVIFITPETMDGSKGDVPPWSFSWRATVVVFICAAVLHLGYSKFRLYYEEMSDALVASRSNHDEYRVGNNDHNNLLSDSSVAVTESFVNCHDRLTEFISTFSREFREVDDNLLPNVRRMFDDVASWNTDLSTIQMQIQPSVMPLSSGSVRRSRSPDISPGYASPPLQAEYRTPSPPAFDRSQPPVLGKARLTKRNVEEVQQKTRTVSKRGTPERRVDGADVRDLPSSSSTSPRSVDDALSRSPTRQPMLVQSRKNAEQKRKTTVQTKGSPPKIIGNTGVRPPTAEVVSSTSSSQESVSEERHKTRAGGEQPVQEPGTGVGPTERPEKWIPPDDEEFDAEAVMMPPRCPRRASSDVFDPQVPEVLEDEGMDTIVRNVTKYTEEAENAIPVAGGEDVSSTDLAAVEDTRQGEITRSPETHVPGGLAKSMRSPFAL